MDQPWLAQIQNHVLSMIQPIVIVKELPIMIFFAIIGLHVSEFILIDSCSSVVWNENLNWLMDHCFLLCLFFNDYSTKKPGVLPDS